MMAQSVSRETCPWVDGVSRETSERLQALLDIVVQWNATINLVSKAPPAVLWSRHILDSLQLVPHIPGQWSVAVDLGSGGGFPGLVLAIVLNRHFHLIESDKRKSAFLTYAAQHVRAEVTVHACRIENCSVRNADLVTSRALAGLKQLLPFAHLVGAGGQFLFLKGQRVAEEITAAECLWTMQLQRFPSRLESGSEVVRISGLSPR